MLALLVVAVLPLIDQYLDLTHLTFFSQPGM
jgi:hypothetical protein